MRMPISSAETRPAFEADVSFLEALVDSDPEALTLADELKVLSAEAQAKLDTGTETLLHQLTALHIERLPAPLREFLLALTVFESDWSLDAAEQICCTHEAAAYCQELQQRGFLHGAGTDASLRYRFIASIRPALQCRVFPAYHAELQARYIAYFANMAHRAESWLRRSGEEAWLVRLDADMANIKAVVALPGEHGLDMLACLWRWWLHRRQYHDGVARLVIALSRNKTSSMRCMALRGVGVLLHRINRPRAAAGYLRLSVTEAYARNRRDVLAEALNDLGRTAAACNQLDDAYQYHKDSLTLMRALPDTWGEASALNGMGIVCWRKGDFTQAKECLHMAGTLFMQLGDKPAAARALNNMILAAEARQDYNAVAKGALISVKIFREAQDDRALAAALHNLGNAYVHLGRADEGQRCLLESLVIMRGIGYCEHASLVIANLGHAAFLQGNFKAAVTLFAAAEGLRHQHPLTLPAVSRNAFAQIEAKVQAQVRPQLYARLRGKGLHMTVEEVVAYLSEL